MGHRRREQGAGVSWEGIVGLLTFAVAGLFILVGLFGIEGIPWVDRLKSATRSAWARLRSLFPLETCC